MADRIRSRSQQLYEMLLREEGGPDQPTGQTRLLLLCYAELTQALLQRFHELEDSQTLNPSL